VRWVPHRFEVDFPNSAPGQYQADAIPVSFLCAEISSSVFQNQSLTMPNLQLANEISLKPKSPNHVPQAHVTRVHVFSNSYPPHSGQGGHVLPENGSILPVPEMWFTFDFPPIRVYLLISKHQLLGGSVAVI
jgi:hypothetical protein